MKRIIAVLGVILSIVLGGSGAQAADKYLFNAQAISHTNMPVGSIVLWPVNHDLKTADGSEEWMICDGRELSSRLPEYGPIFSLIRYSFGEADAEGLTFNIPDLRGMFVRGTNDAGKRGPKAAPPFNDPDAAGRTAMQPGGNKGDLVGSVERDSLQQHQHDVTYSPMGAKRNNQKPNTGSDSVYYDSDGWIKVGNVKDGRTSTETRPVNAYLNYLIRVK